MGERLLLAVGLTTSGAGVSVAPTLDAEFIGPWTPERRAEIEQRLLGKRAELGRHAHGPPRKAEK